MALYANFWDWENCYIFEWFPVLVVCLGWVAENCPARGARVRVVKLLEAERAVLHFRQITRNSAMNFSPYTSRLT